MEDLRTKSLELAGFCDVALKKTSKATKGLSKRKGLKEEFAKLPPRLKTLRRLALGFASWVGDLPEEERLRKMPDAEREEEPEPEKCGGDALGKAWDSLCFSAYAYNRARLNALAARSYAKATKGEISKKLSEHAEALEGEVKDFEARDGLQVAVARWDEGWESE